MPKALCNLFLLIGFLLGALGALVLVAQYLEWQSFGNWNAVSFRYVLVYFELQPPTFPSPEARVWDLPLSAVFIGTGGAIIMMGAYCRRRLRTPNR
jgi:uncharacterized membrane protein